MNDVRVCIRVRTDSWALSHFSRKYPLSLIMKLWIIYRISLPSPTRKITHPNSHTYRCPQSTNPPSRIVHFVFLNVDIVALSLHLRALLLSPECQHECI